MEEPVWNFHCHFFSKIVSHFLLFVVHHHHRGTLLTLFQKSSFPPLREPPLLFVYPLKRPKKISQTRLQRRGRENVISDSLLFSPPAMIIMSARPQSLSYHVSGSVKWGGGRKMLWWERAWLGLVVCSRSFGASPLLVRTNICRPSFSLLPPFSWRPVKVKLQNLTTTFFSCSAQNWPLCYGTRYNVLTFYYHGWKCDGGTSFHFFTRELHFFTR